MMRLRAIILSALLCIAALVTLHEKGGERWRTGERLFLDFLVANARDQFEDVEIAPSTDVVFIEFNERDKAEFSAWPPAPLDYIMALKRIAPHEPDVVAFTDVLDWPKANAQFTSELQQLFLGFP